jgi:hypothetical protein
MPDTKTADDRVEAVADKLQAAADKAAAQGGLRARLAEPLADDAAFVRKLKPSLIAARARGEAPTDGQPGEGVVAPPLGRRRGPRAGKGPNPFLVIAIALAVGVLLARAIDWRSHAHPR